MTDDGNDFIFRPEEYAAMMLTIDLPPELEAQLRQEAASNGIDTDAFIVRTLVERLRRKSRHRVPAHLSQEETDLLEKINQGLPDAVWQEYHDLIAKRRAETLTSEEQSRLIALSESIEKGHTEKIVYLAELASRWCVPLITLMRQLGIRPRKV